MKNYLRSALDTIYGKDDDFILIGLTGQTGSGCSTVAKILSSSNNDIKHSLFKGDDPETNKNRKQSIVRRYFDKKWSKYNVLQVRYILTLLLTKYKIKSVLEYAEKNISLNKKSQELLNKNLRKIKKHKDRKKEFYFDFLPKICEKIKRDLGEKKSVKFYQKIGENIRRSGNPISEKNKNGKFFTLAKELNKIVKAIREEDRKKKKKNTFLVIDAIRNPLEAMYFQERYASFFLLAVTCPNKDRKKRLRNLGYSNKNIAALDNQEYRKIDIGDKESTSVQDIQGCLQKASIYIHNPHEKNHISKFKTLANQVIKFSLLMKHPGLITPTAIERCMQIAYTAKLNSDCISRQVGAVVTDKNFSVQSVGWNDTPDGQVSCGLRNRFDLINGKDQSAYSDFEKNNNDYIVFFSKNSKKFKKLESTGRNISFCFKSEYNNFKSDKNQVHTRSLHAEENAFLQISKYGGRSVEGGNLFTTAAPCELCAKKAYQLGIKKIYYIDPYPGISTDHILKGGSRNPSMKLFTGAIGKAYQRLYTPIVDYKDELNALIAN